MTPTRIGIVLCAISALGTAACSGASDPQASEPAIEEVNEPQTLAELDVDGVQVRFLETLPGALVVTAGSESPANPLANETVRDMSIVQMYEYWTGTPAPQILLDAPKRAAAFAANEPPEDDSDSVEASAELARGIGAAAHTGPEFEAEFCSGSDLRWCGEDTRGNNGTQERCSWVRGYINPIDGDVSMRLRQLRPVRGWATFHVIDRIPRGEHWWYRGEPGGIYAREVSVSVFNADDNPEFWMGDLYHVSVFAGI